MNIQILNITAVWGTFGRYGFQITSFRTLSTAKAQLSLASSSFLSLFPSLEQLRLLVASNFHRHAGTQKYSSPCCLKPMTHVKVKMTSIVKLLFPCSNPHGLSRSCRSVKALSVLVQQGQPPPCSK